MSMRSKFHKMATVLLSEFKKSELNWFFKLIGLKGLPFGPCLMSSLQFNKVCKFFLCQANLGNFHVDL